MENDIVSSSSGILQERPKETLNQFLYLHPNCSKLFETWTQHQVHQREHGSCGNLSAEESSASLTAFTDGDREVLKGFHGAETSSNELNTAAVKTEMLQCMCPGCPSTLETDAKHQCHYQEVQAEEQEYQGELSVNFG